MDAPSQATPQDVTVADQSTRRLYGNVGGCLSLLARWFGVKRSPLLFVINGLALVAAAGMLLNLYSIVRYDGIEASAGWTTGPWWLYVFLQSMILIVFCTNNRFHKYPQASPRHPDTASRLGAYRLCHRIGSGGMGDVYLAEHSVLERKCAIKLIRPDRTDKISRARFEREVRVAARLTHANIVAIYDGGRTADGTFFYVMEFLDGMNLHDLVEEYGPLPTARVVYLISQICAALTEVHRLGLIHRDLKPANIFTTAQGGRCDVVKLLDFGLVKPINDSTSLTIDGMVTGSPFYLSPEQAIGTSPSDQRSDIYSLGAVMYFLLTRRPPFCDEQTLQLLLAHVHRQPTALTEFNSDVSSELEATVLRCLAKDVDDRFASACELGEALRSCPEWGEWDAETAAEWWQSKFVDAY